MKRASIYFRGSSYLLAPSSRTTAGVWINDQPCLVLLITCTDQELGSAGRSALGASKQGVPHPRDWKAIQAPMLSAAGVKSWSTFAKSAALVELEEHGKLVEVVPNENLGPKDGFEPRPAKAVRVARDGAAELGAAIRKLLLTNLT